MRRNVLFVFAHQDDELAAAARIRHARASGDEVTCVYLTDGASRVPSHVRDAESRHVLESLGVHDVRFLGSRASLPDGALPEHLDRALELLEQEVEATDEIVTLAWEGGHQDHDAAHLVAAVFAARRGVRCLEMPLYNGYRVPGPLFRVQHPIGDGWRARRIPLREKLANAFLARHYRSQRSTWLALLPLALLAPARELTRDADLRRAEAPPHRGGLLYERRFRYPWPRFESFARQFLRRWAPD
jgi:LmbE family N-acetylglucosaminyl deacetylase